MYFESREQAGMLLANELVGRYRYENCAVVAVSDGGVVVGEQIASALHCILTMLLIEDISIPGEDISIGAVAEGGSFTYNGSFSSGEIDDYVSEYHGYLDERKREAFQHINMLLGDGGVISADLLRNHTIILVADGLDSTASIDVAVDFLKPISIQRLILATPTASVPAVDRLHILADELHILSVKENFMDVDHYYNRNDIPSHEDTIAKINQIILNWR